jgi:hypothetical protein
MITFKGWCARKDQTVNGHKLTILNGLSDKLTLARDGIAEVLPTHYAAEERIAGLLARLGKARAAEYIRQKLPTSKSIRSGDLGEILGAEYIEDCTDYQVAVNRLRWKDHRNMAMRGDDIIGIKLDQAGKTPHFLKGEIKSRATLSKPIISEARKALRKNNSRPSPHALALIADRLHSAGETDLADVIDDAQLKRGIQLSQVEHLLFTFSGNDPLKMLSAHLSGYSGTVRQMAVGLAVGTHQKLIHDVYEKVKAGGKHT